MTRERKRYNDALDYYRRKCAEAQAHDAPVPPDVEAWYQAELKAWRNAPTFGVEGEDGSRWREAR
jgi:hypothetical protein